MDLYAQRVGDLREMMLTHGWDAIILSGSDPHASEYTAPRWKQVAWVSGFTGEGDLVITADHAGLWTDTRYFIQAERELAGSGIALHKMRVSDQVPIPQWLSRHFAETFRTVVFAVDGLSTSLSTVDQIREALLEGGREEEDWRIINAPDLLDGLWRDRPAIPSAPFSLLEPAVTGWTREQKITWLRGALAEKACDAILLSALDEIAWVLNVRGGDIDYCPLVMSYLVVTATRTLWYVRKGGTVDDATETALQELRGEGIGILDYDEIEIALSGALADEGVGSIWFDPASLNYHLYDLLTTGSLGSGALAGRSPVGLRKAVKNEVEIAGMKKAHLLDGLAVETFLWWLEKSLEGGEEITEADAARKLHELRRQGSHFRGESFATISAYGPSAALPHYVTPGSDAPRLEKSGLYLVDSGAHYSCGTTDITRTIPLGSCTPLEKEDYTLVLKGHIALSRAVFPKGTAGCQIDALAREPLWQSKRNFGHGTGHGVGFCLCVHEGPQSIRQDFNRQILLPGMIVSDEPGIYREGKSGVRHENLLVCIEDGTNDFGTWLRFEPLTLCHFDTSILLTDLLSQSDIAWLNAYHERVYQTLSPHLPPQIASWLRTKTLPL